MAAPVLGLTVSGVCGWVRWDGGDVEEVNIRTMMAPAEHRGPDARGVWCGGGVGLGHLALHDTPESVGERQPLRDREADLVLVADARIDNRSDLIAELAPTKAEERRSGVIGDAALILAAFRRWGSDCPAHLIGDFAFAIWDGRNRRLFAARDPMGMRALHYRIEPDRLLFATEISQILAVPGVRAELFEPAVGAHLAGAFGPNEWSPYRGIEQIAPAYAMTADAGGKRIWRFWDIDPAHRIRYRRDEDYVEHFRDLFKEAVRARLRSTGPAGVLLSGGLDSGSIASTAGWLSHHGRRGAPPNSSRPSDSLEFPELRAYSFAFLEHPECDERHISDRIAAQYGIPVTAVETTDAWPLANYPAHGPDRDDPYAGPYHPLLEKAFAMARADGVRVVLSGDRGDLIVGMGIYDMISLLKSGRWGALLGELKLVGDLRSGGLASAFRNEILRPIRRTLLAHQNVGRFPFLLGPLERRWYPPERKIPEWIRPTFADSIGLGSIIRESSPEPPGGGLAARERYKMIFTRMQMRGVARSQRMHARFAQSFADPWSDRRLAEFALAVPQRVLSTPGADKKLTRRAMKGIMEEESRSAARKIVPYPFYMDAIRHRSRETIEELLTDMEADARGYIEEEAVRSHYRSIQSGGEELPAFWWTLSLEMWLRAYWKNQ